MDMIRTLRRKFVLVSLGSTLVVLAAIMGTVNIVNYLGMQKRADEMTSLFIYEETPEERGERQGEGISPETPFETRYFQVVLDETGTPEMVNLDHVAAVTGEQAYAFAAQAAGKSETGFLSIYRYRILMEGSKTRILFLDCRRELDSFRNFAMTSAAVSLIGMLAVFVLVLIFSKKVFRPVLESYEKQKQFITDAGHEIKTPLTIIDANTEVLEMECGENQWTKSTRNQVKRLAALTQHLVALSRMEEQDHTRNKAEFSLSDAIGETIELFEAPLLAAGKRLERNIAEHISYVGDEAGIRQMTGILMDNAVKYAGTDTPVFVTLQMRGKKIVLEVKNSADQLPKGNLDVLFERFYRLDTSRNSGTGGSGIGLSVAKAIALSNHAKISARSEDGKQLVVTIVFGS